MRQIRTIEEMSMNAWPSLQTVLYDGWVLRFAEGYTRRANSVNPLYPSGLDAGVKIGACEELYASKGLKTIFKITPAVMPENLDAMLASRGYAMLNRTSLMTLDLKELPDENGGEFIISGGADGGWLDEACRLNEIKDADREIMKRMLQCIVHRSFFVSLLEQGKTAACGLGVMENGYMGLFDIVVDRDRRGRGLGRKLVKKLLQLGRSEGAREAYLQVMVGNLPAVKLYESLGFGRRYEYWYRVSRQ